MGRRWFNLAVLLSVLLGIAVVALWGRGRTAPLIYEFGGRERRWDLRLWNGRLSVTNTPQVVRDWRAYQAAYDEFTRQRRDLALRHGELVAQLADAEFGSPRWESLRVAQKQYVDENFRLVAPPRNIRARHDVTVRCRTLVLAAVVLPGVWLLAYWRRVHAARRLVRVGLCRRCGYDLRATPERCPECGMMPV
jgi:hypothetical protein